jgi:hypothetical protein
VYETFGLLCTILSALGVGVGFDFGKLYREYGQIISYFCMLYSQYLWFGGGGFDIMVMVVETGYAT